jgi:hypothetical protein
VRWTRTINFTAGLHRFTVTADDGVRLYVDDVLRLDRWIDQEATTYTVDVDLTAGNHTIKMEYYENTGDTAARLFWELLSPCIGPVAPSNWRGEYFNNRDLNGSPAMVRDDGNVFLNFNFGTGSPSADCGIGVDNFSIRWTRTVNFSSAGNYRFTVTADDGVRLYVDDVLKIDRWVDQVATTYTVDVDLTAGNHAIRLEYYENTGFTVAQLSWELLPCIAAVAPGNWRGEYFNNRDLDGAPTMVRNDGIGFIDFNFGTGSPSAACGIGVDNFSIRWTRTINFTAGVHRFTVTADDGVRLYVDDVLRLDRWVDQEATTYTVDVDLTAGNHTIRLEYYENTGDTVARLSWGLLGFMAAN